MYRYYVAPVRRERRTLSVAPLGGDCLLADTPYSAWLSLGAPDPGGLFAVWALGRPETNEGPDISLEEAGRICSLMPATRVYVCMGDEVILPLDIDTAIDLHLETRDAGAD